MFSIVCKSMETLPVDLACRVRAAVASSAVSGRLAHLLCHPQGRLASHAMTDEERRAEESEELKRLGRAYKGALSKLDDMALTVSTVKAGSRPNPNLNPPNPNPLEP